MPWERELTFQMAAATAPGGPPVVRGPADSDHTVGQCTADQAQILSQLGIYVSLLEEVQCRYSLACKNLVTLLSSAINVTTTSGTAQFSQFFLKKGKRSEEDNRIYQSYHECIQLQVGVNNLSNICMLLH